MEDISLNCPFCHQGLEVDSIREHRNGQKRVYWECKDCNVSVMQKERPNN